MFPANMKWSFVLGGVLSKEQKYTFSTWLVRKYVDDGMKVGLSNSGVLVNPRRACAARVTVLGLCVCLFVCLSVCLSTTILALQATRRLMSDTNSFSATRA